MGSKVFTKDLRSWNRMSNILQESYANFTPPNHGMNFGNMSEEKLRQPYSNYYGDLILIATKHKYHAI